MMLLQPDDKLLVVHRRLFERDGSRFFVGRVDGYESGIVRLTGFTFVRDPIGGAVSRKSDPRTKLFSLSSGTLLVYVSIQPLTSGGSATDSYNIWVSDASTLDESPLTTVTTIGQDVLHPEFSADDAYIAFDGYRPVSIMTPNSSNIWVYDIARATFTPITQNRNAGLDSWLMPGSTW